MSRRIVMTTHGDMEEQQGSTPHPYTAACSDSHE